MSEQYRVFTYELTIPETSLDTFGHVNNAAYLRIFEEARWELITQNGYGLEKIQSTGLGPTILEINIKFRRELRAREKVTIETCMIAYEKKIGKLQQVMKNAAGEICCEAVFTMGLFDTQRRKLITPTDDWLTAIGVFKI